MWTAGGEVHVDTVKSLLFVMISLFMGKNKQVDNFANAAKHPATTQDVIKLFRYLLLYWCLSGRLLYFAKRLPST